MKFVMWTWYHYLYIVSPFILAIAIYYLFKNKSEKTKYWVVLALAIINVLILFARNISILVRLGRFDAELIPLGPCHLANFLFLIAVVSKKQTWYTLSWCFNLPFGFLAIIFCDSLENYSTMLAIRPMAYIWGHMFLCASIIYVFMIGYTKFNLQSFKRAMTILGVIGLICILSNITLNSLSQGAYGTANYMYMYNTERGTPLDILYDIHSGFPIWNTTISPIYITLLSIVGLVTFFLMYILHQGLIGAFKKK